MIDAMGHFVSAQKLSVMEHKHHRNERLRLLRTTQMRFSEEKMSKTICSIVNDRKI